LQTYLIDENNSYQDSKCVNINIGNKINKKLRINFYNKIKDFILNNMIKYRIKENEEKDKNGKPVKKDKVIVHI